MGSSRSLGLLRYGISIPFQEEDFRSYLLVLSFREYLFVTAFFGEDGSEGSWLRAKLPL
jgi:hypothetical protein